MQERSLSTEAQYLKGVGPRLAAGLAKAGLHTVGDVLYYLPRRYEDRRNLPPISSIRPGQFVTVRGKLTDIESRPTRKGMVILKAIVTDKTGSVTLTWFNQPWIRRQLEGYKGEILAYGQAKEASWGYEINSPEWEMIDDDDDLEDFARIVPIYPLTEGLKQKTVRKATRSAVQYYLDCVVDPLPRRLINECDLKPLAWSLRQIHDPQSDRDRLEARKRLVFEEFYYMQLALAMRRAQVQQELGIAFPIDKLLRGEPVEETKAYARKGPGSAPSHLFVGEATVKAETPLWDQVHQMLPFELTGAQRRVIEEIWSDMSTPHPMNRLVQGDVGSGKTAVAACAMLAAVRSGFQAAMMAPTEILAEQHYVNLHRLLEPLGIDVALLVGKQTAAQKKKEADRTAAGSAQIAVGTHALIQEGVKFHKLGLAVIDEQHRFGVLQRAALRDKSFGNPDVLVMTATPIPRTLTMTLYGDLDVSIIDELPPGRRAIKTHWKQPYERSSIYAGVRKLIGEGRQAYFVCPMVSESEKMNAQAAEDLYYRLSEKEYPDLRVGLLHGQMKPREKEEIMLKFRSHELDILVSTTVIEVGVDVPNASVMVVEDANRFGLSQLHQLRGRVGRGEYQSYCILIADGKGDDARARMEAMVSTADGFKIAEEDLRLRGPGEIAGTRQSGNLDFKIADLVQDARMLEISRQAAIKTIERDPCLELPEHRPLHAELQKRRSEAAVITVS